MRAQTNIAQRGSASVNAAKQLIMSPLWELGVPGGPTSIQPLPTTTSKKGLGRTSRTVWRTDGWTAAFDGRQPDDALPNLCRYRTSVIDAIRRQSLCFHALCGLPASAKSLSVVSQPWSIDSCKPPISSLLCKPDSEAVFGWRSTFRRPYLSSALDQVGGARSELRWLGAGCRCPVSGDGGLSVIQKDYVRGNGGVRRR